MLVFFLEEIRKDETTILYKTKVVNCGKLVNHTKQLCRLYMPMLHQDNKKRLPPSSPEFIEALTLGNSSCRNGVETFSPQSWVISSLLGNPDQARCSLENGKGLVIFVVRRIRPMHCWDSLRKIFWISGGKLRVNSYDWEEISESTRKSI